MKRVFKQIRPTLFIGSSTSSLPVANALKAALRTRVSVSIWNSNIFKPSKDTLNDLMKSVENFDFGVFVFAHDDIVKKNGRKRFAARDNVIFECGLFYGGLGRDRTFFLTPNGRPTLDIPSDLFGITSLRYTPNSSKPEVKAASQSILDAIESASPVGATLSHLNGTWKQSWQVTESAHFGSKNSSLASVLVVGDTFLAEYDAGKGHYKARGKITHAHFITGNWWDMKYAAGYHGTFQLVLDVFGKRLDGKWIGWSSKNKNKVMADNWRWTKQ